MNTEELLKETKKGFKTLGVRESYQESALTFLKEWLTDKAFAEYVPQIEHIIQSEQWDYLLDCFYKVIPFGTGGRRGEVGIGPNRINPWTIQASAQGHSQFLIKKYGEDAKKRGVVFTYDVRQFFINKYLSDNLPNPLANLDGAKLSQAAAEVYAANGIKIMMFDSVRTTPELSFAIRYLNAIAGDMFSASHNPPDHNGKKVYDEFGGQLIPPEDEELVDEVTKNVDEIKTMDFEEAKKQGFIEIIGEEVDDAYIQAASKIALSKERDIKIVYTPLHGCGVTSVPKILKNLGFEVLEDPKTSNVSGKFENVTFNIPNPEVIQSFDTPLIYAKEQDADIILNSDPDADRIGIMVKHNGEYAFLNGNEIAAVITEYVVRKRKETLEGEGVVIKTTVTTNLLTEICKQNNLRIIGELLVGFKYVGEEMNKLEQEGNIQNLLLACEESHGYLSGDYARDKDAAVAAVWLAELAAELKKEGKTMVDFLNEVYAKYGYFRNYLTEIRMLGATGLEKIKKIQDELRKNPPKGFGGFEVKDFEDCHNRKPIVSETDRVSKDVLIFTVKPVPGTLSIKVTVRPSGTEPKIKMYFEIGSEPTEVEKIEEVKRQIEELREQLEKAVMKSCYKIIDVDFPDRGFLLFWQLPLSDKMKYFEIEGKIEALKDVENTDEKKQKLGELLSFLGSDPIMKVDPAFKEKNGKGIEMYLGIS